MPCPRRQFFSDTGAATLTVTRESNINRMGLRKQDLNRSTGVRTEENHGTSALEETLGFNLVSGHSYNLFLFTIRKATSEDGSVAVKLVVNGVTRANTNCSANGNNPTAEWRIVVA